MPFPEVHYPLIVIIGPTAVGKTEVSIQIAKIFDGEIISADSRLFYRGMDIGTAKPTKEERDQVKHHLIDIAEPDETIGLAQFQTLVTQAVEDIHSRKHIPFLVGGTGQFVKAVIEGWQIPPQPPNPWMREHLSQWASEIGAESFHRKLSLIDPEAASFIQIQNVRRAVRAMEVIFLTGKKFSDQRRKSPPPYEILVIGLIRDREELYRRIDQRINLMIELGFVGEVARLIESGYSPDLPSFSAIGYQEVYQVLLGQLELEEAIELMKRRSRIYVRRQANWFKEGDERITWLEMDHQIVERVSEKIKLFLSIEPNKTF